MIQSLNGKWRMIDTGRGISCEADIPGSVYSTLIEAGDIGDPYYRENEYEAMELSRRSYTFEREFTLEEEMYSADRLLLRFNGIDTVADIYVNGAHVGRTENMHRVYSFDITPHINQGVNSVSAVFTSPLEYIAAKNKETPLWGVSSTVSGYPHMRKAHYMFGWDWGPKLPDMGIWRDVELVGVKGGLLSGVYVRQDHSSAPEKVGLDIEITLTERTAGDMNAVVNVVAPDGSVTEGGCSFMKGENKKTVSFEIADPQMWFPRGYGEQPLYRLTVELFSENGALADKYDKNLGLRTIDICREKDDEGESFAFEVNGIKIFAMGANYIPEDQIIAYCSEEKTESLLADCCKANFNMIRVWGGGYYPSDFFYDCCDRMGLLVWQDFMFACSVYKADHAFCDNVKHELIDNIKRIRSHPSLAMWCGNNEIESMWQYWNIDSDPAYKKDYLRLFEALIPKVLDFYDPVTYYHPSSPSSGGSFDESSANNRGDQHYWDVWHGLKPFTEYFRYNFRFCSEYGFESLPSIKTIRSFAEDEDMNLCSPVMELHQKCEQGTEKIMYYLAQMAHYPYSFEGLIYATQIVQSDAIRLNVENMRRRRGICMGSLYWQVNDSNPVISWSSIDYFHRWKALHYAAKRFYAPVLVSADSEDTEKIKLNVSSERSTEFTAQLIWYSRNAAGGIISRGSESVTVKPFSAEYFTVLTPENTGISSRLRDRAYIEYALIENGVRISGGTFCYVQPKAFRFVDPELSFNVFEMGQNFRIEVTSKAYAKGVCLDLKDGDAVFSDNWFDLHGGTVNVYLSRSRLPDGMTAEQLRDNLTICSYYEAMGLEEQVIETERKPRKKLTLAMEKYVSDEEKQRKDLTL